MAQSRKDLFQAHRLMTQRASLALLRGEPDMPDQPLRRLNVAAFSSALVAAIVVAGFAIWALLGHGGGLPALSTGTLITDAEGQEYVFCNPGNTGTAAQTATTLCPVVNYASARLVLGTAQVTQQTATQEQLTRYRRGPEIGIPGLPPLPAPGLLVKGPWSVCTKEITRTGGSVQAVSLLAVGVKPSGTPLAEDGLVLQTPDKQYWMIWHGMHMSVPAGDLHAVSRNTPVHPVQVGSVWLDALPPGPPMAPPAISGRGTQHVPGPDGTTVTVGQLYRVRSPNAVQYYVMQQDGLSQISQTQAQLLAFQQGTPDGGHELPLDPSRVSGHLSKSDPSLYAHGLPGHMPHFTNVARSSVLCDVYSGTGAPTRAPTGEVRIGATMPSGGVPTGNTGSSPSVDKVLVRPQGAGALVGLVASSGRVNNYYLIAGSRRYGLASGSVVPSLGYSLATELDRLPASVVGLIPVNQQAAFDPKLAREPVHTGTAGTTGTGGTGSTSGSAPGNSPTG